ncbi:HalOD1 output domain-containing protein [Halomontanus rarus]|uniref:HalOD1 output domain-containing protein n=1 Tax=Halomontanus rarus TaxID=3034020 RepID=UPI001A9A2A3F|nr:HalOD1 output domain-containing protein [Halovivax sp. TS33]
METTNLLGTVEFDLDAGVYRARYDPEATAPSVAVVDMLRAIDGADVAELEPLYEVVDPEGLDLVLEERSAPRSDERRPPKTVSFPYRELVVTVRSDGVIDVASQTDAERESEGVGAANEER